MDFSNANIKAVVCVGKRNNWITIFFSLFNKLVSLGDSLHFNVIIKLYYNCDCGCLLVQL